MGPIVEGIKTVNAAVRTALLAALAIGVGWASYFAYGEYTQRDRLLREKDALVEEVQRQLAATESDLRAKLEEIERLDAEVAAQAERIDQMDTAMRLLKTDQRLARLDVLGIERDEAGKAVRSRLAFAELSPMGEELSEPKRFELPGDIVYIDNWIVKFDDAYIERADIERGTSLCLFRRIFSEEQTPSGGISLDEVGMRPQAYARGGALSEFERRLWSEFWEFANDPARAAALGIRAANGEAVSIQVREGQSYHITLRASGGLSIVSGQ